MMATDQLILSMECTSPAWTKAWNTVKPPNKGNIGELRSYVSLYFLK